MGDPIKTLNHLSFESCILWEIHFPNYSTKTISPDLELTMYLPEKTALPYEAVNFDVIEDEGVDRKNHKKTYQTLESLHQLVEQFKHLIKKFRPNQDP